MDNAIIHKQPGTTSLLALFLVALLPACGSGSGQAPQAPLADMQAWQAIDPAADPIQDRPTGDLCPQDA